MPNLLLKFSVQELHNILVIPPKEGGLEKKGIKKNVIINDPTLRDIVPPQLKIWHNHTKLCVGVSVTYIPKECIQHYYHGVSAFWENLKIKSKMHKTEGLVKFLIVDLRH